MNQNLLLLIYGFSHIYFSISFNVMACHAMPCRTMPCQLVSVVFLKKQKQKLHLSHLKINFLSVSTNFHITQHNTTAFCLHLRACVRVGVCLGHVTDDISKHVYSNWMPDIENSFTLHMWHTMVNRLWTDNVFKLYSEKKKKKRSTCCSSFVRLFQTNCLCVPFFVVFIWLLIASCFFCYLFFFTHWIH